MEDNSQSWDLRFKWSKVQPQLQYFFPSKGQHVAKVNVFALDKAAGCNIFFAEKLCTELSQGWVVRPKEDKAET